MNGHFEDGKANSRAKEKGRGGRGPIVYITPLHYAARVGDAVMTSLLLRMGADVNSRIYLEESDSDSEWSSYGLSDHEHSRNDWGLDSGHATPLSLALAFGNMGIVSILKSCGGEVGKGYFFSGNFIQGVVMYMRKHDGDPFLGVMYTKDAALNGMLVRVQNRSPRLVAVQPFPDEVEKFLRDFYTGSDQPDGNPPRAPRHLPQSHKTLDDGWWLPERYYEGLEDEI